ncbi:hypothetical protein NPIL_316531 [Nephila pilipes]|uniref:Uncharacterized protein n=1 Tax=Nephila pilipes TaxID=299642 RepID=A0A8X6QMJ3_NEPPI|nr:hypothetical protein NPIL_316531 [Nephila pilipes]
MDANHKKFLPPLCTEMGKATKETQMDANGRIGNSNKDSSILFALLLVCSVLPPVSLTSDHAVSGAHLGVASQGRPVTRVK